MSLIIGAHDITEQESTQLRVSSNKFIIHPQWNEKKLENDIALVKLPSPIKETSAIKSIQVVSGKNTYAGTKGKLLYKKIIPEQISCYCFFYYRL